MAAFSRLMSSRPASAVATRFLALRPTSQQIISVRDGGHFTDENKWIHDIKGMHVHYMQHSAVAAARWEKVLYFFMFPMFFVSAYMFYVDYQHELEEEKHYVRDYIEYPYLAYRAKPYPWKSNKSFFHNPYRNYIPGVGFEKRRFPPEEYEHKEGEKKH